MVQILERLEDGRGELGDIELLKSVGSRILGKSLCALGDFAVYPVASYVKYWEQEFIAHVEHGRCPYDGDSTLEGIVAPSDDHAEHAAHTAFDVPARGRIGRRLRRRAEIGCAEIGSRYRSGSRMRGPFSFPAHRHANGGGRRAGFAPIARH